MKIKKHWWGFEIGMMARADQTWTLKTHHACLNQSERYKKQCDNSLSLYMKFVNFVIVFFASIIIGKIARLVKDMLKFWTLVQWQGLIELQPFTPSCLLDIICSTKLKGTRSGATIHSLSLNVYMNFVNFIIDLFFFY